MQETGGPTFMDDIIKDFLIESAESLDRMDQDLVNLKAEPASEELLASIFRTIHTIKGSCGFLGFKHLERVTYAGENLLSSLRDGQLKLRQDVAGGLLGMAGAIREMLEEIRATGGDGANEYAELVRRLKQLQAAETTGADSREERKEAVRRGTE